MGLIEAFFCDEVDIKPFVRQGAGEAIYGGLETRSCRMEEGARLTSVHKAQSGQIDQVEARATMFCVGDKIPNDSIVKYGDEEYVVIDCQRKSGFGFSHWEVYLM